MQGGWFWFLFFHFLLFVRRAQQSSPEFSSFSFSRLFFSFKRWACFFFQFYF
ncbi:hypothetical protein I3842_05G157700 [Carya illinoinensis]|uniref:Uncharacterized protein n=1 Tax=Carya illinoinensis TaxID=32201 RepID=A0A922JMR4_CARIL|nr:hypothetical protein I3842_05G157700 [Carya illinoinensis]